MLFNYISKKGTRLLLNSKVNLENYTIESVSEFLDSLIDNYEHLETLTLYEAQIMKDYVKYNLIKLAEDMEGLLTIYTNKYVYQIAKNKIKIKKIDH